MGAHGNPGAITGVGCVPQSVKLSHFSFMRFIGRPRKHHSRSKAAPVEDKDIQGIFHEATAPQPSPVKRRRSIPLSMITYVLILYN